MRLPLAYAIYRPSFTPRAELAPWRQWGEGLEAEAVKQMANACALPVAVAGALMPDAHVGYGLPIGGVLATDNAVIPYAVGAFVADMSRVGNVVDHPRRYPPDFCMTGRRGKHDANEKYTSGEVL